MAQVVLAGDTSGSITLVANAVAGSSVLTLPATTGLIATTADLVPTGTVFPYAGGTAPNGYLLCAGQAVSRTTYAALYSIVGVQYGVGNGSTTFNVPDLRGRAVFGLDNMGGTPANRVTNAISQIVGTTLGAVGGNEIIHAHSHGVTDPGHSHTVNYGAQSAATQPQQGGGAAPVSVTTTTNTTGITVDVYGSGASQNMPPTIILTYIIKY